MRFAIALVTLLLAGVLVAAGVAQRTVLRPADHVTVASAIPADVHYVVVPGALLRSHAGQQRLHVAGGDGAAFAAYGRTSDVTGWLSGQRYAELRVDGSGAAQKPVIRTAPVIAGLKGGTPDPDGSDLWMDQQRQQGALDWNVDVPSDVSVIVASDGAAAAPSTVSVTWPSRTATPWAVPMIIAGGALAVLGLLLYIWALVHVRRRRGPRRKSPPRMPKRPQPPKYRPQRPASMSPVPERGRRSVRSRVALCWSGAVAALVAALLVPVASPALAAPASTKASVSEAQANRIVQHVAAVAARADAKRDAGLAAQRFSGAALELRTAGYRIKAKDKKAHLPQALPTDFTAKLILPEATTTWPRGLFVTVTDNTHVKAPPIALALMQNDPRADYRVEYAMALQAGTRSPVLPSALDGATRLDAGTAVLQVAPADISGDFGRLLLDAQSSAAKEFDRSSDDLVSRAGEAAKKVVAKKLGSTAGITFTDLPSDPATAFAMSTADSGALVAVQLDERWTVKPKRSGVTVRPSGGTKVLSKVSSTSKGISSTYGFQLLFAVPSAGSDKPVTLLGYAQGLVSAKEL